MTDQESYFCPFACWTAACLHLLAGLAMYVLPVDGQNFMVVYPLMLGGLVCSFVGALTLIIKVNMYGNSYTHFTSSSAGLLISLALPLLINGAAFLSAVV